LTHFRPQVRGKFVFVGEEKLFVKGVTYGTFRPNSEGELYPEPQLVARDFAQMAANGVNVVRVYTVPPRWLLDLARQHGLWVMVGLSWEQHVCFLDDYQRTRDIRRRVRAQVQSCAGHPAIFAYTVGNEIPAAIVRWHGPGKVQRFLHQLYREVKREDPEALVTYINYPTTEYLDLPFLDFVGFNVYLESQERLEAYLARLQNLAGDRPLIMAEIGLDSRRNGVEAQAEVLDWQLRTAFAAGCAGGFIFAWTDEWYRGGYDIEDWDFGITRHDRRPKPALASVSKVFAEAPFPADLPWPRISAVVCSYNGARTIRDCLEGLTRLEYPDFEVIIVDDGSSDATAAIAAEFDVLLIRTTNRGLSQARNTGMEAATGEIVAYLDDDARPDPHWLHYLAYTFMSTAHAGVGGPNFAPPGDGTIADCIANAPGGPIHVLLTDQEAEHIPGCNMAFRKVCLEEVGGFDPQFRVAGDDVDICWSLQRQGWTLGFHPAAMVWHHRRNSVRTYWKQQQGYGKAEALLAKKWPEKYNATGHPSWAGRLYSKGLTHMLGWGQQRIYYGSWGSAPFQSVYQTAPTGWRTLLLMPEWYLIIAVLAALSTLGALWQPLLLIFLLFILASGASLAQAGFSAAKASFTDTPKAGLTHLKLWGLTTGLYLLQPLARLRARLRHGLTPGRRGAPGLVVPYPRCSSLWSEKWQPFEERLEAIEAALRKNGAAVTRGGEYDRWDIEVLGGLWGTVRLRGTVEEHGAGKELIRVRSWPRCSSGGVILLLLSIVLGTEAALDQAWAAAAVLAILALLLALRIGQECAKATAAVLHALRSYAAAADAILLESELKDKPGEVAVQKDSQISVGETDS
jgi:GT2 family glycosyltransferase